MTTLPEQLFNMPLDVLLAHADCEKFLRELGVRTSTHPRYTYLCIKSPMREYNIATPTAKRIINNALTFYKHRLGLERERQETDRRLERERAREAADREATVRFKANR